MAENKKGFILYADIQHTIKHLSDEQAGKLFKHLLSYVNDENPETDDVITNLTFEPIKQQLKRDLDKWETTREKRSKAGKASAESRKNKKQHNSTKSTRVKSVEHNSTKSTVSVNDNVNVTVNDNVNVTDILLKKKQKKLSKLTNKDFEGRSDRFMSTWKMWLEERKTARNSYKTERSEKMALNKLIKESKDENHAIETIETSIASGYQGLFPKKERKSPDNRTTKERVADIMGISRPESTHNGNQHSEGSVTIDADFEVQDD